MLREIEEYFKYINNYGYTKHTINKKNYAVRKLEAFMNKENITDLDKIDCLTVEKFKSYLKELKCGKASTRCYLQNTREFFNYLVSASLVKTNPFVVKNEPFYPEELKKYFDEYLSIKGRELSSSHSLIRIKSSLKLLLSYFVDIQVSRINDLTKNDIKSFISHMIDVTDKKGNKVYKAVSINRILFDVRNFFLFLKDKNLCVNVISAIVNLRQAEKVSRNILTKKQITNLFKVEAETLYQFMMKTIFVCLYSTGLRISELLSLTLDDIDFDNKVLTVYESKTGKERYVHIGEVGINYLKIYIKHARDSINYETGKSNLLFASSVEDSRLNRRTINNYLKIFCAKAGITKKVTTHCFRHSYGSHLLENGAGIKVISELLGHSQISSTERYTRLGSENLREIVNRFHPREQEKNKWN